MNYLLNLVPWYVWVLGLLIIGSLFIPGVGTIVLGLIRTARAAWALLPDRVKIVIGALAGFALLIVLHFWDVREKVSAAESRCDARWEKKLADAKVVYDKALADLKTKQQEVVTRTVIQYRDRTKVVKEEGDAVVQIIPALVTGSLPGGVRVAHDAAASGHVPDNPGGTAAAADPVEAAALLTTVAENYQSCRADAERLIALQALVTNLGAIP